MVAIVRKPLAGVEATVYVIENKRNYFSSIDSRYGSKPVFGVGGTGGDGGDTTPGKFGGGGEDRAVRNACPSGVSLVEALEASLDSISGCGGGSDGCGDGGLGGKGVEAGGK